MEVAMVNVWIMRMRVSNSFMLMNMAMRFAVGFIVCVFVLMVRIMKMNMLVLE